jgi:hypothetical protein
MISISTSRKANFKNKKLPISIARSLIAVANRLLAMDIGRVIYQITFIVP